MPFKHKDHPSGLPVHLCQNVYRKYTQIHTKVLMALQNQPYRNSAEADPVPVISVRQIQRSEDLILQAAHGPRLYLRIKSEGERCNCVSLGVYTVYCLY
jgi:hypothetical protein